MSLPPDAGVRAFAGPEVREHLRQGTLMISHRWVQWEGYTVLDVEHLELGGYVGRSGILRVSVALTRDHEVRTSDRAPHDWTRHQPPDAGCGARLAYKSAS